MNENVFTSTVVVVLPGDHIVTYVVRQDEGATHIDAHHDADIPHAAAPLLLLQLCSAIIPAGLAGFHVWKGLNALKADFEAISDQMANVPAIGEDELPF